MQKYGKICSNFVSTNEASKDEFKQFLHGYEFSSRNIASRPSRETKFFHLFYEKFNFIVDQDRGADHHVRIDSAIM